MSSNAIHARNCSIYVESSGASTAISPDLNSANLEMSADAPDVTGFGDNTRQRLSGGLIEWTLSLDGYYGRGATAAACILFPLLAGSTFIQFGPAGSTSGCQKLTGSAVMTSLSFEFGTEDAATMSCEFQSRAGSLSASAW